MILHFKWFFSHEGASFLTQLSLTITSLIAATQYDTYCSTAAGQISTKLDIATSGFTITPALSNIQGTKLTVTHTSSATENTRCVGIANNGNVSFIYNVLTNHFLSPLPLPFDLKSILFIHIRCLHRRKS